MKIRTEMNLTQEVFRKAIELYTDDWNYGPADLTPTEAVNAIIAVYFDNYEEQFWIQIAKTFSKKDIHDMCEGFAIEYRAYLTEIIFDNLNLEGSDE